MSPFHGAILYESANERVSDITGKSFHDRNNGLNVLIKTYNQVFDSSDRYLNCWLKLSKFAIHIC